MSTHNTHYATNSGTLDNRDLYHHYLLIDGVDYVLEGFVLCRSVFLRSGTQAIKFFSRNGGWSFDSDSAELATSPDIWRSLADKNKSEFVQALFKRVS